MTLKTIIEEFKSYPTREGGTAKIAHVRGEHAYGVWIEAHQCVWARWLLTTGECSLSNGHSWRGCDIVDPMETGWINIYQENDGSIVTGALSPNEEDAKASKMYHHTSTYLKTAKLEVPILWK